MSGLANPADWVINWVRGIVGTSGGDGKRVSQESALSYAPIWYGVNKISGHIAQLPVAVFKRGDSGGERQREHDVAKLLRRPNAYQTASVFREQVSNQSLLDGNGRAAIVRSGSKAVELIPLHPDCTATGMLAGEKIHATRPGEHDRLRRFFRDVNDQEGGDGLIMLEDEDVVHVPGLSLDGITGLSLRRIAQRNLNAAINTEKRFAQQMEQGFSGSLMLEAPAGVFRKQEDAEEFLEAFEKRHNSPEKAGKTGMLREGMKANILQSTNRDSEMTDNRKFQRQDAALWLGLEQILGDDSSVSYNSLEQKNLAYLMNCLNRWLKRWEEELERKLLTAREFEADSHYIRFNTAALLKSDYKTSVESLSLALQSTIITRNEAREKLDLQTVEGGDGFMNPNITPGESRAEEPEPEPAEMPENASNPAVRARLEHLIGVESKRVQQAADKGKNFVEWIDNFYASNWGPKLADWCEELGIERDRATQHCDASKDRLLEVCGYSNGELLTENVRKCVSSWPHRAGAIITGEF